MTTYHGRLSVPSVFNDSHRQNPFADVSSETCLSVDNDALVEMQSKLVLLIFLGAI